MEKFRQDKIVFIRNMHMNAVVPLSLSDIGKSDSQREYGTTQTLTALDIWNGKQYAYYKGPDASSKWKCNNSDIWQLCQTFIFLHYWKNFFEVCQLSFGVEKGSFLALMHMDETAIRSVPEFGFWELTTLWQFMSKFLKTLN